MTHISITKLYDPLSTKIGKEGAENLTNFIEYKIVEELESKTQILATRDELHQVESRLERKIGESKVDMIKWMFAFWITIVLMIVGLYLKK